MVYNAGMNMKRTQYERIAEKILKLIKCGTLRKGDRLPSVRSLSREMHVSINTVKDAYWMLENQNYIHAVPQSGFYVSENPDFNDISKSIDPAELDPRQMNFCQVYGAFQNSDSFKPEINLGISNLNYELWPVQKFNRFINEALKYNELDCYSYLMSPGFYELRKQIARLSISSGMDITPDDVVITNGCHEAVFLSLMTVCKAGDTIVLESPLYFSALELIEQLGLKVIELPIRDEGINLDTLTFIFENHDVKALFLISNFNNPSGYTMPDDKKKELVDLLKKYRVTLIEDDVYGDLFFKKRPAVCRSFDNGENVMLCSSFSKTTFPGLRVGWVVPGIHFDEVNRLKTLLNISTPSINQIAMARFLKEGGYDRHLRKIRSVAEDQVGKMRNSILRSFPEGTSVSDPEGGNILWVELPEDMDSYELYELAVKEGILIAPGCLFSLKNNYQNCFRICAGIWNGRVESAVEKLGELAISIS